MNAIANKIYTEDEPEQFAAALKLLPNIGPFKTDASNKPKPMTQQTAVAKQARDWLAACVDLKFAHMNLPTRKDLFGENGFDTKKALAVAYAEYYAKIRAVYGEIGTEVDDYNLLCETALLPGLKKKINDDDDDDDDDADADADGDGGEGPAGNTRASAKFHAASYAGLLDPSVPPKVYNMAVAYSKDLEALVDFKEKLDIEDDDLDRAPIPGSNLDLYHRALRAFELQWPRWNDYVDAVMAASVVCSGGESLNTPNKKRKTGAAAAASAASDAAASAASATSDAAAGAVAAAGGGSDDDAEEPED
jgi:hypothetical protein